MYMCICICVYVYVYMYMCICICVYVYMCIIHLFQVDLQKYIVFLLFTLGEIFKNNLIYICI